jgi:hypothetical protein
LRSLLILLLLASCSGTYPVGVRQTAYGTTTWYPAHSGGEQMRMRDYVPLLEHADMILHARGVPDEAIVDLFDTIMLARRNAPPRDGAFTVVTIVRKAGETAADHAFLGEYLAHHGFIVRLVDSAPEGVLVVKQRVPSWDFAVDKERATKELERVRAALRAEARR